MIEQGWRLVISHGNGPQVEFILRRSEMAQDEVDPVPLDYAVADTQGAIGSMFVKALINELRARGLAVPVIAIVTHSVVSLEDPYSQPNQAHRRLPQGRQSSRDGEDAWLVDRGGRRTRLASNRGLAAPLKNSGERDNSRAP